jgi:hypothetical protein
MGVLFTYEKVTRCPFFANFFRPFKRTKARNTTVCRQSGRSLFRLARQSICTWTFFCGCHFSKCLSLEERNMTGCCFCSCCLYDVCLVWPMAHSRNHFTLIRRMATTTTNNRIARLKILQWLRLSCIAAFACKNVSLMLIVTRDLLATLEPSALSYPSTD